jgi:hypothetical protein
VQLLLNNPEDFPLAAKGTASLMIARAELGKLIKRHNSAKSMSYMPAMVAGDLTYQFNKAIALLREAESAGLVIIGYISRSYFQLYFGNWQGARGDLNEAEDIATRGPFMILCATIALARARTSLFECHNFCPLSPREAQTDNTLANERVKQFKDEAIAHLRVAEDIIKTHGYRLLEAQVNELKSILDSGTISTTLPPLV